MRLVAALLALPALASTLRGQPPAGCPPTRVVGKVTAPGGAPLAGAEIRLVNAGKDVDTAHTTDDGKFAVSGCVASRDSLRVRRIGYHVLETELLFPRDSTRTLDLELDPVAVELEGIEVSDSTLTVPDALLEFRTRRSRSSIGHFFTRGDILARQPRYLSELLRRIPGISLRPSHTGGYALRIRGCNQPPMIWIDRGRTPYAELDEVTRVDDVAALEVYTSGSGVPAQYLDRTNLGCGTILVWTRRE